MLLKDIKLPFGGKIKVYAFVGPSGTGKSYRAQMVANEKNINFIIDDGLLIKENEVTPISVQDVICDFSKSSVFI